MKSFIQALAKAGKKPPFSVQEDFQTHPGSLLKIIDILNLPDPDMKKFQHSKIHDFTENNAQGITYGYDNVWYLSSEKKIFIYSFSGDDLYKPSDKARKQVVYLSNLIEEAGLNKNEYDHIGDISYYNGLVFASVRHHDLACIHTPLGDKKIGSSGLEACNYNKPPHLLLVLSKDLKVVGYTILPEDIYDAWCAINPWNGLLYMQNHKHSEYLSVFDVSNYYHLLHQPARWRKSVAIQPIVNKYFKFYKKDGTPDAPSSIQGIAFSENGRLYISRYNNYLWGWKNYIYVYNALTGTQLSTSPRYDFKSRWDEIEGLSIHPSGIIYVAVADNDGLLGGDDEFEIHAFQYPDKSHLV